MILRLDATPEEIEEKAGWIPRGQAIVPGIISNWDIIRRSTTC